jgi:AcrR family transcriptional regulator
MGKGAETRDAILRHAIGLASVVGLEGLTIGGLAKELAISKSGLIAHFGTKEALQLSVLQAAAGMFGNRIIVPAQRAEPGEARLRVLFENWLRWTRLPELPGGCIFDSASAELDDRPGICRYFLARIQKDWLKNLEAAVTEAIEAGQFRANIDASQVAFDIIAIHQGFHFFDRLLRDATAEVRARAAFNFLVLRARQRGPAEGEEGGEEEGAGDT